MRGIQINSIFLIIMIAGLLFYSILPSLSAGILIGTISLILTRISLIIAARLSRIRLFIPLLNITKFFITVALLFGMIRWMRMDAVLIAVGYTMVFIATLFELYLRRVKES